LQAHNGNIPQQSLTCTGDRCVIWFQSMLVHCKHPMLPMYSTSTARYPLAPQYCVLVISWLSPSYLHCAL
jgi:hypothetical protein